MVAIHGDELAAALLRLALDPLKEVEGPDFIAATVEDVADLNDGGGAATPVAGSINEAGETERLLTLVEVAVDVADGDEAVRGGVAGL